MSHLKQDFTTFLQWLLTALVLDGGRFFLFYIVLPFLGVFVTRLSGWAFDRYAQPFLNRKFFKHETSNSSAQSAADSERG